MLADLRLPVVAAPMAGGPSTPALVAAVSAAGGLGFVAAGYRGADALATDVAAARRAGPFGVNLFVPEPSTADTRALRAFRDRLAPLAARLGTAPGEGRWSDDDWDAKAALLLDDPVPVVSFTFGLPPADLVRGLQARGTEVVATVASRDGAVAAAELGVDALCVQGPEAGGHRATLSVAEEPGDEPLLELLAAVRRVVPLPLLAAGGLMSPDRVERVLDLGAAAAQCGTAFLLADEAGTGATHRAALLDDGFAETVVTRAFSGRPARGLRNAFADELSTAPAAYPEVNAMTTPLRRAAAEQGDAEHVHLWAGTRWRGARAEPAAAVARRLGGA